MRLCATYTVKSHLLKKGETEAILADLSTLLYVECVRDMLKYK